MLILKDQSTSQLLLVEYLLGLLLLYSLLTLLVGSEITDKRYTRKLTLSFFVLFFYKQKIDRVVLFKFTSFKHVTIIRARLINIPLVLWSFFSRITT